MVEQRPVVPHVERIGYGNEVLCLIIRREPHPEKTTFFTSAEANLQVGKIVYPAGGEIPRHTHRKIVREVTDTSEVLIVESGRMMMDIYTCDRERLSSHELATGDIVVLLRGGHGFRLLEDTILVEVKQGPYRAEQDKDRF